jgi:hypothetical protein
MSCGGTTAEAIGGGILLVMLVHAVETAKFAAAWTEYKSAVRALAMGTRSDPSLGSPSFVSAHRIYRAVILVVNDRFPVHSRCAAFCAAAARGRSPTRQSSHPAMPHSFLA